VTKRRLRPDIVIATIVATIFLVITGAMESPATIEALSRAGEINIYYQPYLNVMAVLAVVNATLILALVPIYRRTAGWLAMVPLWTAVVLSTFIVSEVCALVLVNQLYHKQHVGSRYTNSFVFSPVLGIVPKPNFRFQLAAGELTHTTDGYRGPEPPAESLGKRETFVMIGGSSTYDIGLPDDQTWPSDLGRIFPNQIRVLNLGIPGHSTAEHITLASLVAWKYHPDVIVYYIGWNDIRSSHLNESTDYSRFHKMRIFQNFAVTEPTSFFALGYLVKKALTILDESSLYNLSKVEIERGITESIDEKLLEIYLHNVRMLAAITREIGAIPVFVPQIMNVHRLTSDQPYGWIPQIPQRALPKVLARFNDTMIATARAAGAVVIPEVLEVDWQDSDFVDRGHFSQQGAERFACVLTSELLDRGVIVSPPPPVPTAEYDDDLHQFSMPLSADVHPPPGLQLCLGPH
jgi:hypothetical protein